MRSGITWLLIIVIITIGLTQILLPLALEGRVERALRQRLAAVEYLAVDIQSRPALMSLVGRFRRIRIEAKDFVIDDLPVGAFLVQGRQVKLDPRALYRNGEVLVENAADLRVTVLLTEDGINQYLWEKVDPEKRLHISLMAEGAALVGNINFFGHRIDINLRGVFQVREQTKIIFVPEALTVENLEVPQVILNALVEDKALLMDLVGLPVPLIIDEMRLEQGQLYAFGHYAKLSGEGR